MTWTYSGDPSGSDKDKVRFLVSDTNSNAQLVQDEEINWALSEEGIYGAASIVARSIAANYAKKADFTAGKDLSVSYARQSKAYSDLADKLVSKASNISPLPFAGGISVSDKENYEADTDRVSPKFRKDKFMDNKGIVNSLTDED